jgi:hypothetical protein
VSAKPLAPWQQPLRPGYPAGYPQAGHDYQIWRMRAKRGRPSVVISAVGEHDEVSTSIYAKVDQNALRPLARP